MFSTTRSFLHCHCQLGVAQDPEPFQGTTSCTISIMRVIAWMLLLDVVELSMGGNWQVILGVFGLCGGVGIDVDGHGCLGV